MSDDDNDLPENDDSAAVFDLGTLREDAAAGAKAVAYLFEHRSDDWERWVLTIRGLRGLRDLARHKAGTHKATDFAFRQEIGRLLSQRQYAAYDRLSKQQRNWCSKLMDRLEDIDEWYHGRDIYQGYEITDENRMEWKSPQTIAKHCPPQLLEGGEEKRQRAPTRPQLPKAVKPQVQAEIDRLRRLLLDFINIVMTASDLATARTEVQKLVKQVMPPELPDDSTEDI